MKNGLGNNTKENLHQRRLRQIYWEKGSIKVRAASQTKNMHMNCSCQKVEKKDSFRTKCIYRNVENKSEIEHILGLYEIKWEVEQKDAQFASEMLEDICEEYQHVENIRLVVNRFLFAMFNQSVQRIQS